MLRFQSESIQEAIPIEQLILELTKGGDQVIFSDSKRPGLRLLTVDQSILDHRVMAQSTPLRGQLAAILGRRELVRRVRLTLLFLLGCVALGYFFSWGTGAMVRSLANRVPPEWEQKFGGSQIEEFRSRGMLLEDSNKVAQLTALAAPLIPVLPLGKTKLTFHIVLDPEPNAFALPGGHVCVNSGLLRLADRPEEILGVIAHEVGHVTQKHHFRRIISAAGPLLIFGVFLHSGSGVLNMLSAGAGVMVFEGFSQEYEKEADDVGWRYLVAANIDPRGMITMFKKLKSHESAERAGIELPQAFQSHPALDKRIARLEARFRKLHRTSGFLELTSAIPQVDVTNIPVMPFGLRRR